MKRRMVRLFASALSVLALTFAAVGPAFAGPGTDTVKAKQSTLFDLLRQGSPDAQKKIDAVFDEMMDYAAFAEASLGTEWAARSDAEKAEFSDILIANRARLLQSSQGVTNMATFLIFDIEQVLGIV